MSTPLDDSLVRAFEARTIDPATFHHREHLYVAWCYLRALPLEDALARYTRHLRALTAALGVPEKYHATMTWAYLIVLDQVMERSQSASFDELLAKHPALLDRDALYAHYERAELDSAEARRRFILPRCR
ncbi:MAG: hypothetical protein U0271_29105 [Polyangiaceae bacterium]